MCPINLNLGNSTESQIENKSNSSQSLSSMTRFSAPRFFIDDSPSFGSSRRGASSSQYLTVPSPHFLAPSSSLMNSQPSISMAASQRSLPLMPGTPLNYSTSPMSLKKRRSDPEKTENSCLDGGCDMSVSVSQYFQTPIDEYCRRKSEEMTTRQQQGDGHRRKSARSGQTSTFVGLVTVPICDC